MQEDAADTLDESDAANEQRNSGSLNENYGPEPKPNADISDFGHDKKKMKAMDKKISTFHMASWDIFTIHSLRLKVHEYYFASARNQQMIWECYEALLQMFMVFKHLLSKGERAKLDDLLFKWEEKYVGIFSSAHRLKTGIDGIQTPGPGMASADYAVMRRELLKLIDQVYSAKTKVGLRIPYERAIDESEKMNRAMGVGD